jgi:hypothetical protein
MTAGVDATLKALQAHEADILVVACLGREDDRSLQIIHGAHRSAPTVPIIVVSATSPNGFLGGRSRSARPTWRSIRRRRSSSGSR